MAMRNAGWALVSLASLLSFGATALDASRGECSRATLKGSYGFLEQGTLLPLPGERSSALPYANVGIAIFDGAGHLSGTYTASFGGMVVSGTVTGTYTVNPDCTYSDQFIPSPLTDVHHHAGTVTGEGMSQGADYIYADAGLVARGIANKTPVGRCSLETFKGTYAAAGEGTDVSSPIPGFPIAPPFPLAHVATLTADGSGHVAGQGVENVAGVAFPATFTATYTVSADCTVSLEIEDTAGGITLTIPEVGTITGEGQFQELRSIISAPGVVFADSFKRR